MDRYPSDQTGTAVAHKPKRTVLVVVALVIVVIVAFSVLAYLHRPTTGTVTAVNATSITIRPSGSSTVKTFSITNTTMIGLPKSADDGGVPQQFNENDIHSGETVVINVNPSNNQAQAITVNP
ncbi:MAG TPA: hypothetical protein VMR18_05055 [Candidatus Saccharimonadales bacterium]|jgi:hypothetical protein|nr:hypothetical protein [Candidatus Saccharimonadales bacterium]